MSEAPLLLVEDFFDSPVASGASISPDGRRIAYLASEAGRVNAPCVSPMTIDATTLSDVLDHAMLMMDLVGPEHISPGADYCESARVSVDALDADRASP